MKCSKVVEEYIKSEENLEISFFLIIHIFFCKRCRKEISALKQIFTNLQNDSIYKVSYDMSSSIMNIIRNENMIKIKTISGFKWVTIGSIIFFSIFLLNFSESFLWLKNEFGSNYTIPLSIVMGFVLTGYAAILIGCNYEYIKKYIDLHTKWKIK